MKIGTKSVLFGAHCFIIHPWFVAAAWWKLYGFPNRIQYWVAFFVHDIGYWGKPNMDGEEGEKHPETGAKIMHWLFDRWFVNVSGNRYKYKIWYNFCYYHSRFLAKRDNTHFSMLCVADKLAIALEPAWFYLLRVNLSGEVKEYMALAKSRTAQGEPVTKYESMRLNSYSQFAWFRSMAEYLKRWVEAHKDGKTDTWTPSSHKETINENGVWK